MRVNFSGPRHASPSGRNLPDRLIAILPGATTGMTAILADLATKIARLHAPKMSGQSSSNFTPIWGQGWYGLQWMDEYVWYQEAGIRPFTMFALAGKTIPMWINDPTGRERSANPKARTRVTASGVTQVLIFRKVARIGARRKQRRKVGGVWTTVSVPASYPGAPGRISMRGPLSGASGGRIYSNEMNRHVGVRWRHPGLSSRGFIQYALYSVGREYAMIPTDIYPATTNPVGRAFR